MDGYILCRSRQNIHTQWFKNLLETAQCHITSNWLMDQIPGQGMLFLLIVHNLRSFGVGNSSYHLQLSLKNTFSLKVRDRSVLHDDLHDQCWIRKHRR